MKKLFLLILLLFVLVGCSSNDLKSVNNSVKDLAHTYYKLPATNNKKFYSYYLPPFLSVSYTSDASSIIKSDKVDIILNVDFSNVINEEYYKINYKTDVKDALLNSHDKLTNKYNQQVDYNFCIFENGKKYNLILIVDKFYLFSNVYEADIYKTAMEMMTIAKSITIDSELIVDSYSNKHEIDYVKKPIQLFNVDVPENGRIEEILNDSLIPAENDSDQKDDELNDEEILEELELELGQDE